jgi:ATP phosphoribosyltransferase
MPLLLKKLYDRGIDLEQQYLTIALSKGTLLKPTVILFEKAELPTAGVDDDSAADLGIVGKDVIVEQGKDVFEMVDLQYGYCRFVVAAPEAMREARLADLNYKRVATKFPVTAERFFRQQGLQVEIIKLHGNIELAPLMGLSDVIVDIVSTGRTLRENNLFEIVKIMDSTTRLICNRVSYRTKYERIQPLIDKLQSLVKGGYNDEN